MTTNRNLNNNYYKIKTIVIIPIFKFLGKRYSCLVSHMIMFAKHVCQSMESLRKSYSETLWNPIDRHSKSHTQIMQETKYEYLLPRNEKIGMIIIVSILQ